MGKLIYFSIASLDGYLNDRDGNFDWAEPDPEVHGFVNELERDPGTYLYGRRMYETMIGWETMPELAAQSPLMAEFAEIWQSADKVVYSTTLAEVSTSRTRIERTFDPDAVRELKDSTSKELSVAGAGLASSALRAGLVDECRMFVVPVLVGGGTPIFPDDLRLDLELLDERRFAGGTVYLRYRCGR